MLALAELGEVLGGSGVWMLKSRKFITHVTGESARNPVFARGMLTVLDDKLGRLIANPPSP